MGEVGERSRTRGRPRPRRPAAPGTIAVLVNHSATCWDSNASGTATFHPGATITVRPAAGGTTRTEPSGADGRASFANLPVGNYRVEASAPNYRSASANHAVRAGATTNVTLEIALNRGTGVICSRRHTARPSNAPTVTSQPPIFWHSSLMIWAREAAWLLFLVLMVVFMLVTVIQLAMSGSYNPLLGGFCLPALCYGIVAYLTAIIFGEIPGYITIITAGLAWVVLTVIEFALVGGVSIPPLAVNVAWLPPLCAMWLVFIITLIVGRQTYSVFVLTVPIVMTVVGLVLTLALYFILIATVPPAFWANPSEAVGVTIMVILAGIVASLVGAVSGHVFRNDGNLETFNPLATRMALPYAGEQYCVQGNRGWFSHYASRGEEPCYDFAVPEGTHVLAIEEGHVIKFRENRTGSRFDSTNTVANYIYVEHRDGKVARYFHLKQNGVTEVNPVLIANSTRTADANGPYYTSDVHVHAGQILAAAGNTGESRFPHIHLGIYDGATGVAFVFKDASVQIHAGRCYTFRKYLSETPDNGQISI
jgi:hypothetical protein